jgi:hypothetical protein
MILKASQRANGADLAVHLMNACDNERIEVAEVSGTVADDLFGAFAEVEVVARGTKAQQPLYSLSISPPASISRAQYFEAIAAIEKRLGLAGQPRAVVFHVKNGREHCHVVWSRIDTAKMRAIPMSHDHSKLMDLACDLARQFGFELPEGLRRWEEKRRQQQEAVEPTLAENAIEAATGVSPEERRAAITTAFEVADGAEAFRTALEERGYLLARGDRRGFVVVDLGGNVHSLSRYVEGYTARQVRERLAPLDPEQLQSVEEAKETMRQRRAALEERMREEPAAENAPGQDEDRRTAARRADEEARLGRIQRGRRGKLAGSEQDLKVRHASERTALHAAQRLESENLVYRLRRAVAEFIDRTPGLRSVLGPIQKMAGLNPADRHRLEREALARRHAREQESITRKKRFLARLEARERQSMERRLARAEAQDRALAMEQEKIARAEQERRASEDRWMPQRTRPFEDGELSFTFNEESFGGDDPSDGRSSDGEEPDGPGDDGPGTGDESDGPPRRRRRPRRRLGY